MTRSTNATIDFASEVPELRPDLQFQFIEEPDPEEGYWVVKDPLGTKWFFISGIEKRLLELARGRAPVRELCIAALEVIGPLEATVESIAAFYYQARSSGLLRTKGPTAHYGARRSRKDPWLSIRQAIGRLLAFRLPGLSPESLLKRTSGDGTNEQQLDCQRWITISVSLVAALLVVSLMIVVGNLDRLIIEVQSIASNRSVSWLLLVALTIAIAKSIHELAHVFACRFVGAECREIGLMILFGTPCLYCDVSDLWTVPERWKRAWVSAAGVLAELALAGLAAIVWSLTSHSVTHQLALMLMLVCSVSTVMVNGNPLLRYDGYFVLSDWLRIPNLATQANESILRFLRRLVWGKAEPAADGFQLGRSVPRPMLCLYATLSGAYRLAIVAMLLLALSQLLSAIGLQWIPRMLLALFVASTIASFLLNVFRKPASYKSAGVDAKSSISLRPTAIAVGLVIALVLVGCIPIPRRISTVGWIVVANCQDLYALQSGRLVQVASSGEPVEQGQVLFEIQSDELSEKLLQVESNQTISDQIVVGWENRRGMLDQASAGLALARKRAQADQKELQEYQRRKARSLIQADRPGELLHRLNVDRLRRERVNLPQGWLPGEWIAAGTHLGSVGDTKLKEVQATVSERELATISVGSAAWIRHASIDMTQPAGRVIQIKRSPWQELPVELRVAMESSDLAGGRVSEKLYQIRIQFDQSLDSIPAHCVQQVVIDAKPTSFWSHLAKAVMSDHWGI